MPPARNEVVSPSEGGDTSGLPNPKYPSTPYWPWSPTIGRGDDVLQRPERFVGQAVVATEKLDGGCTLLHGGRVYARSVSTPSKAKWMAMVKKHHAWKVTEPDLWLYGEDIYGVHSIVYDPVPEDQTFYAFALRDGTREFAAFGDLEHYAKSRRIPLAPVLFRGVFRSLVEIREFLTHAHAKPSALGGEREGVVLRLDRAFLASEFPKAVCKSVRPEHVQTDEHWTRKWKPCRIAGRTD